jgi:3-hydroxyacyl-CoA dehydrogenase/enoyl-CoA hydratase/3-hydroxybutyryl-CoA epimerase/enoyl-CoA isomerase
MVAIDVIEQSASLSRDAALKIEHEGFVKVSKTPQTRAMVQIFLSDQLIKSKAKKAAQQVKHSVKKIAVIGAGIMGGGIAYQSASKGLPVIMKDIQASALDLGMNEVIKLLNKGIQRKKITPHKMAKTIAMITPTTENNPIRTVDFVVEAVVENPKIKESVLKELETYLSEDSILTSNTSTISINRLAKSLKRPENFCGMHFFNPVHKMPLVEVIRGEKTSDATIASTVAYASKIGKSAIVVQDCPGFYVNRVLFPYFRGFSLLLSEGVDFRLIDKAMTQFGWPMGPAYLLDVVGMDTAYHCAGVLAEGFPERMPMLHDDTLSKLYHHKKLGQKSGQGFYQYSLDKKGRPKKTFEPNILELIGKPKKILKDEEIVERMMLPLIFEVIRCLDESIIDSPQEADMALVLGIGFPPFRGGALKYADEVGLDHLFKRASQYTALDACYAVPQKLKQLAEKKQTFYR